MWLEIDNFNNLHGDILIKLENASNNLMDISAETSAIYFSNPLILSIKVASFGDSSQWPLLNYLPNIFSTIDPSHI